MPEVFWSPTPPTKMPRNWEFEYTPVAVPLAVDGEILVISDGTPPSR